MAFVTNTKIFGNIAGFAGVIRKPNLLNLLEAFQSYDYISYSGDIIGRSFQLEPNTTYTLSTNAPETNTILNGTATCLLWLKAGTNIGSITKALNGAWEGSPRSVTTGSDGVLIVCMRKNNGEINLTEDDIVSGKYWARLEKSE